MGNKERIILCTDDIRPYTVTSYWSYWNLLKAHHPKLKLNAFVVPHYFKSNFEVILNSEFLNWYNTVKDWVDLHLHGYAHTYPPECTLSYSEQEQLINEGIKMLSVVTKKEFGFKAPGYHSNGDTIEISKKLGLSFLCNQEDILWFKPVKLKEFNNPFYLYQTHTNGESADSIENIYEELDQFFKDKEFLLINDIIEK